MISIGEEFLAGLFQLAVIILVGLAAVGAFVALAMLLNFFYVRVLGAFFGWLIPSQWHWFNGMMRSNWDRFWGQFHKGPKQEDYEALSKRLQELEAKQGRTEKPPP